MTENAAVNEMTPEQAQEWADFQKFRAQQAAEAAANVPLEYYVHLADGSVVTLDEAAVAEAGTHYNHLQIIGRYQVGA